VLRQLLNDVMRNHELWCNGLDSKSLADQAGQHGVHSSQAAFLQALCQLQCLDTPPSRSTPNHPTPAQPTNLGKKKNRFSTFDMDTPLGGILIKAARST
jgi:hypothetical protein